MKLQKQIVMGVVVIALGAFGAARLSSAQEGKSLEQMITQAKTAADPDAPAAYHDREAQAARQKYEEHLKMKGWYENIPHLASKTNLPWHCNTIATNYQQTAKEYEALAKLHREMMRSGK